MITDEWWKRLVWGAFGALIPEVIRRYRIATENPSHPFPKFGRYYFLISVLFVGVGGMVSVAWNSTNPFQCLIVGAIFPAIISKFSKKPPTFPEG